MPVEFLGMIGVKPSEDNAAVHIIGGGISREYLCEFTRAHEDSDFDGVLVGYTSGAADGLHVAQAAADCTDHIKFLIAHRPGFVAPTLAARKFATLDYFTGGRVSVHIITGGHDVEQQRDGDWKDHDERYRRTGEYLSIMRRTWEHDAHGREPFDFDGEFYQVVGQNPEALPVQPGGIPLYFGGASDIAFEIGVKHCDVYMMWGEPRASIAATIERIHEMAAVYGRKPRLSVSFRPIIAPTEDQAWEKAHSYLNKVTQLSKQPLDFRPQSRGSQRLLEFAAKGDVHDERLWMPIAGATGAAGNTSALVGTPEQVAEVLLKYIDLGVSAILIRGFDPLPDTIDYGKELIPMVKAEVARRDSEAARQAKRETERVAVIGD